MCLCVRLIECVCAMCVQLPEETRSGYKIPLELQTVVSRLVWVLGPKDGSMGDKVGSSRSTSALRCVAIWLIDMGILPFPEEKWAGSGGGRKEWEERKEGKFGLDVKTDKQRGVQSHLSTTYLQLSQRFLKGVLPRTDSGSGYTALSWTATEMGLQGARELSNPVSYRVPWG